MSDRKAIYHSELAQATRVTVKSDALISKYKKEGEAGHYYVSLEVDGRDRSYLAENEGCARTLASYKGDSVTVRSLGRGEQDARIEILKSDGTVAQPAVPQETTSDTATPTSDPVTTVAKFKSGLMKILNAFYIIEKGVEEETDQIAIDGVNNIENFGGKCGQAFRKLDAMGLVDKLPDKPLWSVTDGVK